MPDGRVEGNAHTGPRPAADVLFGAELLASLYDVLDPDRSDLEVCAKLIEEFGATSVLDIGCGTGCLVTLLPSRGISVIALEPALATSSLRAAGRLCSD